MIRITKGPAPAELVAAGGVIRLEMELLYTANELEYRNGDFTFDFPFAYKSTGVKRDLYLAQKGKCCFSEAKFVNDVFHVEHFRPKGRVDKWPEGKPVSYPGYYWLAYDWSNLFLCKSTTNSSIKRNFFPLMPHAVRNRSHLDRHVEPYVIIHPCDDEPRHHIRFKNEEIKGTSRRGRLTIKVLNLRNAQLDEARRTKFQLLDSLRESVDMLLTAGVPGTDIRILNFVGKLKAAMQSDAEFSSMATDMLTGWPPLELIQD